MGDKKVLDSYAGRSDVSSSRPWNFSRRRFMVGLPLGFMPQRGDL